MKKIICAILCSLIALGSVSAAFAAESAELSAPGGLTAFPGAEGGGMYTTGAREASAPEIYHVTKLTDDGSTGTFRDAVSEDNRIIVFDVAGYIELDGPLTISSSNLTILGQTAPGDGIAIKDAPVIFNQSSNVIMRYMRFRMGTENANSDSDTLSARRGENLIFDHCSMSWSVDECASFYQNRNFTLQWCIITEPLNRSIHDEGDGIQSHGYCGIWGGINASFHHNLLANAKGRFPRIGSSETTSIVDGTEDTDSLIDIRNNVFYNWKETGAYGGENGTRVNLVSNYYKEGPASIEKNLNQFYEISAGNEAGVDNWGTDLALSGNFYEAADIRNDDEAALINSINADNTADGAVDTSDADVYEASLYDPSEPSNAEGAHTQYINDYPVTTQDYQAAYSDVLMYAGASKVRDSVDARAVSTTENGNSTADPDGDGLINSPDEVGGWPTLTGTKETDTDNDGIPDTWEDENGLNKDDASDALDFDDSGYLNIEVYANSIVETEAAADVDKSDLNAAINEAEVYMANESQYTAESWQAFETSYNAARAVANSMYVNQDQVDAAARDLRDKIGGLTINIKAALQAAIAEAEALNEDDYTPYSYAKLTAALGEANTVNQDPNAQQDAIDAAETSLRVAMNELTLAQKSESLNQVVRYDFNDGTLNQSIPTINEIDDTTPYYYDSSKDDFTTVNTYYVQRDESTPDDLALYLDDTGESANETIIRFTPQTEGKISIKFDLTADALGGSMRLVNIQSSDEDLLGYLWTVTQNSQRMITYNTGSEIIGGNSNGPVFAADAWSSYELIFDIDNNTVTYKCDGVTYFENESCGTDITDIASIMIRGSEGNADRHPYVDNFELSKVVSVPVTDLDTTRLEALISTVGGLDAGDYDQAKWADVQAALTEANSVMAYENKQQPDVDKAYEALNTAYEALGGTIEPPEPEDPVLEYAQAPALENGTVTASVLNTLDEDGAMFIVAVYNSEGALKDAKVVGVPMSDTPAQISDTIGADSGDDVKVMLWNSDFAPAADVINLQ